MRGAMSVEPDVDLLHSVPFLSSLSHDELTFLSAGLRRRVYRRNEVIFHRDDPGTLLFIIRRGRVKISLQNADGSEVTLALFGPSGFFVGMSLLYDRPRSANASAL